LERKIARIIPLLEEKGYKTRGKQIILEDLKNEKAKEFSKEITILNTNEFEIIGDLTTNKLVLKTTTSNQIVDIKWFKKLGALYFIIDVANLSLI
jgi:SOS-response transcriptional repressor LexA